MEEDNLLLKFSLLIKQIDKYNSNNPYSIPDGFDEDCFIFIVAIDFLTWFVW